jgi:hypothetical protein
MEISPENSETMAFVRQDPIRGKINMDDEYLQVRSFKYLSCKVSYYNEKDVQ